MITSRVIRGASLIAFVGGTRMLGAQQATAAIARQNPWQPFHGCWSTSSAGVIGPMVCVVPTETPTGAEFMTVDGDSIVARTIVDASGRSRAHVRGDCAGWEDAQWSSDQQRLYMHASYRCSKGVMQRSDAIVSMTHADAFTQVERTTTAAGSPARVVNFIVQLDTTAYPVEVRRRLGSYRPLTRDAADLESMRAVSVSDVIEAATSLDPAVVEAWLDDRGERPELSSTELRVLRVAAEASITNPPLIFPSARGRVHTAIGHYPVGFWRYEEYRGAQFPTNILVTPAMVGLAQPSSRSFTWHGWP
jgi:hypothetical protein